MFSDVELTESLEEEFSKLLSRIEVQAVVGEIEREVSARQAGIVGLDFGTNEGLEMAKALQNQMRGLQRALDILTIREEDDA